ncbi:molybdopterin-guanine dinucleotide biosynthesis protein B [Thalassobacillus hwangdonensis]|uniref:Molybdopterin-guanine dinucleotide biosynthesis protein B n=1 Tax=Thalassobacillus hwangdonensis TaxID=546108 RepID=A0ABW3KXN2_9BACI
MKQHAWDFPVYQVVGFKNSGKTTVMNHLIHFLKSQGVNVATIKHHGHHSKLSPNHQLTDSFSHKESGAFLSGVEGGGSFQLDYDSRVELKLEDLLHIYSRFQPDIVLVEGFKNEAYPKILVLGNEEERELLYELEDVRVIISRADSSKENLPEYHLNEVVSQCGRIMHHLERERSRK